MKLWNTFIKWLSTGKITTWKSTDKELSEEMGWKSRVGSHSSSKPEGETYQGIKITLPIPDRTTNDL